MRQTSFPYLFVAPKKGERNKKYYIKKKIPEYRNKNYRNTEIQHKTI